jgi:hypothetical protein
MYVGSTGPRFAEFKPPLTGPVYIPGDMYFQPLSPAEHLSYSGYDASAAAAGGLREYIQSIAGQPAEWVFADGKAETATIARDAALSDCIRYVRPRTPLEVHYIPYERIESIRELQRPTNVPKYRIKISASL